MIGSVNYLRKIAWGNIKPRRSDLIAKAEEFIYGPWTYPDDYYLHWEPGNHHVACEFFCIMRQDLDDPEDQGSLLPEPECSVHWSREIESQILRYELMLARLLRHQHGEESPEWVGLRTKKWLG